MQHHTLIGEHDHPLINAELWIGQPAHPTKRSSHRRECREILLIDELKLALIERVHAKADAERVDNTIARTIARPDIRGPIGHDLLVVQRHPFRLCYLNYQAGSNA